VTGGEILVIDPWLKEIVPMANLNGREGCCVVSTMLTPDERMRVDAVGTGLYQAQHRNQVCELIADVRDHRTKAIIISLQCYEESRQQRLVKTICEVPQIPTIVLLSTVSNRTPSALVQLGKEGIRCVIDVRSAYGWQNLREYLSKEFTLSIERYAVAKLEKYINEVTPESWTFLKTVFQMSENVASVRLLAKSLEILPSTLMSRFFRAGLPAPKRYLAMARLVRAARLFENRGFSVANVANHLEYSSPQSFGRHVRTVMGVTAGQFRQKYSGAEMMEMFDRDLVMPYVRTLAEFNPLSYGLRVRKLGE